MFNFINMILLSIVVFNATTLTFSSESCASLDWQIGLQDSLTPVMDAIIHFHSHLMFFLVGIGTFVFWLLGRCLYFYREGVNLEVDNFTHSTFLETTWTIVPAVILLCIAVPSYGLLYSMDELLDADLTAKVIGNQWYWVYEFSDFVSQTGEGSDVVFESYMVVTDDLVPGSFRLLEVDNRFVLPVFNYVRLLVNAADVLHSWAVPSLGIKVDACPGRLNQVNLFLNRTGIAYGQCSEICGVNHGFMPICVEVVRKDVFQDWIKSKLD